MIRGPLLCRLIRGLSRAFDHVIIVGHPRGAGPIRQGQRPFADASHDPARLVVPVEEVEDAVAQAIAEPLFPRKHHLAAARVLVVVEVRVGHPDPEGRLRVLGRDPEVGKAAPPFDVVVDGPAALRGLIDDPPRRRFEDDAPLAAPPVAGHGQNPSL